MRFKLTVPLLAALTFLTSATAWCETLAVSAAVSLKEAMTDVAKIYEQQTGDTVQFSFGSSGQLAAQIVSGAPVDVFISAAAKQVDDLAGKKLVDESTQRVIAGNAVVLIAPIDGKVAIDSFEKLADPAVQRVAIGEPKTVPAGQYAMQVLTYLKLAEPLKERLIYGTNVRQVLNYVERGEVDAGIVYATDAATETDKVRVVATAPAGTHDPVVYPAVMVLASSKPVAAKRFIEFLTTAPAAEILKNKGFSPPPDKMPR